jgi:hypothetical protein
MNPYSLKTRGAAMLRTLAAFLVAPLVPGFLYWLFYGRAGVRELPAFFIYGGIVGYPVMGLVGVPAYLLIRAHGQLRAKHVLWIGTLTGALVGLLMSAKDPAFAAFNTFCGFSAGVAFWLVWYRRPRS